MPSYKIDSQSSKLVVTARSSVHNTDTSWRGITGTIEAPLDNLEATKATIEVDMTTADAGDWLKNRKLRKDMDFDKYPRASLKVERLSDVQQDGSQVSATLHGTLSWRGKSMAIEAKGSGTLSESDLSASGSFELNVTQLGITPPKVLMIKIEDVVGCQVELSAKS
jgi:polyisoprenoid-binding protein YceI